MKIDIVKFRNGTYGIRRKHWFRYQFLANHLLLDEWRPMNNTYPRRDFEYGSADEAVERIVNIRGVVVKKYAGQVDDVGRVVPNPASLRIMS